MSEISVSPPPPYRPQQEDVSNKSPVTNAQIHQIHRKPLPSDTTLVDAESNQAKPHLQPAEYYKPENGQNIDNGIRDLHRDERTRSTTRRGWSIAAIRARFSVMSRRRKILILAAIALGFVTFLVLVIVLPVVLTHRSQNLPLPTAYGGPYIGDLTYYEPGLGACGITSTDSQPVVAISQYVFDQYTPGGDPNANPLCGMKIRAKYTSGSSSKTEDLTIVDRCVGCQSTDIDVSPSVFQDLTSDMDLGRVKVQWSWLQGLGG